VPRALSRRRGLPRPRVPRPGTTIVESMGFGTKLREWFSSFIPGFHGIYVVTKKTAA